MKITVSQIRRIIKEEVSRTLRGKKPRKRFIREAKDEGAYIEVIFIS